MDRVNVFFIKDEAILNIYSHMLPEDYAQRGNWQLLAAEAGSRALGILAFENQGDRLSLCWLYVEPEYRWQGVGGKLIDSLLLFMNDCSMDMPLEAEFESLERDDLSLEAAGSLYGFFDDSPYFDCDIKSRIYTISPEDRRGSETYIKYAHKGEKPLEGVLDFFELPTGRQQTTLATLADAGYVIHDIESWKESCIKSLCRCTFDQDKICNSAVFFTKMNKDCIMLSFLYLKEPAKSIALLAECFYLLDRLYPEAEVRIETVNSQAEELLKFFFPNHISDGRIWLCSWNYGAPVEMN